MCNAGNCNGCIFTSWKGGYHMETVKAINNPTGTYYYMVICTWLTTASGKESFLQETNHHVSGDLKLQKIALCNYKYRGYISKISQNFHSVRFRIFRKSWNISTVLVVDKLNVWSWSKQASASKGLNGLKILDRLVMWSPISWCKNKCVFSSRSAEIVRCLSNRTSGCFSFHFYT